MGGNRVLRSWGANTHGQLANRTQAQQPTPGFALRWDDYWQNYDSHVEGTTHVAAGARHGLAVRPQASPYSGCPVVWTWGDNSQGQLGAGSLTPNLSTHVQPSLPLRRYFLDLDGDGFGDTHQPLYSCLNDVPAGYAEVPGDCDDSEDTVHPGATEVCDGLDNNCNGQVDEDVGTLYYRDADGDGWGNGQVSIQACSQPAGYVTNNRDCNDANANVHPGMRESCMDHIDNNCDGHISPYCG